MKSVDLLDLVAEARRLLASGALQLPLRVEGWHKSLSDGGHYIRHATGRILATVKFVPVENDTGRPALDGNPPARGIVALLNAVPALCDEVERLRQRVEDLALGDSMINGVRILPWLKSLETVINQAQPATSSDDNPDHYIITRESLQSIVEIHQELAKEQGGVDDQVTPHGVTRDLKRIKRATNPLSGRMQHGGGWQG